MPDLLAGVVGRRQRLLEGRQIALQPLADRLGVAAQDLAHALAAAVGQMRVQRREAVEHRHRHHEVAPREADEPLDLALVVALGRPAEAILEQIVRLQLGEHARALALAVAEDLGHRDLRVVVQDRLRHARLARLRQAAEERERLHVAVAERLRRLGRIRHHEVGVRMRQIEREVVDLLLHAADDRQRLAEVGLRVPRRMHQRHEHLLRRAAASPPRSPSRS